MLDRDSRQHRREVIHGSALNLCDTTSTAGGSGESSNFVKCHKEKISQSTFQLVRLESGALKGALRPSKHRSVEIGHYFIIYHSLLKGL